LNSIQIIEFNAPGVLSVIYCRMTIDCESLSNEN